MNIIKLIEIACKFSKFNNLTNLNVFCILNDGGALMLGGKVNESNSFGSISAYVPRKTKNKKDRIAQCRSSDRFCRSEPALEKPWWCWKITLIFIAK